jgi:hypothetical protein
VRSVSPIVELLQQIRRGHFPPRQVVADAPVADLNDLPLPDYGDFFVQARRFVPGVPAHEIMLPYECSRGCWWGCTRPCRFCGCNTQRVPYREKAADLVARDLAHLRSVYGTGNVNFADLTIPKSYYETLIPRLAQAPLGLSCCWAARAPLSLRRALDLQRAGVTSLLLGIESFSTRLLEKIGKGTCVADNVAALRHCRIAHLASPYYLLYGIPGDTVDDYEPMPGLIALDPVWASKRPHGPNPSRVVLVVVMAPPPVVGKVQVSRHVGGSLARGPVIDVVHRADVAEIAQSGQLEVHVHQCQFIDRRKKPALDAVQHVA